MSYLTLAIKSDLTKIANSVSAGFEPNLLTSTENYNAFSLLCVDQESNEFVVYGADVNQFIYDNFEIWKSDYNIFHSIVVDAYADKFKESSPSLEDCKIFCENVLISKQYGVISGITELNLTIKQVE